MKKLTIPKETLEQLYYEEQMSIKEISKHLHIGYNTAKRRMEEYGIKKRNRNVQAASAIKKKHAAIGYKTTELQCPVCEKDFKIKNSLIDRAERHFCSVTCSTKFYLPSNIQKRKTGEIRECAFCNKETYKPLNITERFDISYCSVNCMHNHRKSIGMFKAENNPNYSTFQVECYHCQTLHDRIPSNKAERNYCSMSCMSLDYRNRMLGQSNPFWKGGWEENYGIGWKTISLNIRRRDSFTCQRCLRHKDEFSDDKYEVLHAHHIIPFRLFNGDLERAHASSNLVTLCNTCHPFVEKHGIDFDLPSECIVQTTTEMLQETEGSK